ncbi:snare-domain-containing protein [Ramicandelaber brevisporus]|nr:snare-domain-containing protein [Ramicandelaber brevisporus]
MYQQRQLQRQAQQQLLDNEVAFNEQLIAEREQDIVEIERGIVEVNEIFRDLGTIVTEQTPLFDNIESNVHIVDTHIENAVGELDQADHYHRQSRKNALYLMLIVIFVGTVLIIANSG